MECDTQMFLAFPHSLPFVYIICFAGFVPFGTVTVSWRQCGMCACDASICMYLSDLHNNDFALSVDCAGVCLYSTLIEAQQ